VVVVVVGVCKWHASVFLQTSINEHKFDTNHAQLWETTDGLQSRSSAGAANASVA
jgi:hypothetical protein